LADNHNGDLTLGEDTDLEAITEEVFGPDTKMKYANTADLEKDVNVVDSEKDVIMVDSETGDHETTVWQDVNTTDLVVEDTNLADTLEDLVDNTDTLREFLDLDFLPDMEWDSPEECALLGDTKMKDVNTADSEETDMKDPGNHETTVWPDVNTIMIDLDSMEEILGPDTKMKDANTADSEKDVITADSEKDVNTADSEKDVIMVDSDCSTECEIIMDLDLDSLADMEWDSLEECALLGLDATAKEDTAIKPPKFAVVVD